jgi:hypothetical protein
MPFPLEAPGLNLPAAHCLTCRVPISALSCFPDCDRCSFQAALGNLDDGTPSRRGRNIRSWSGPPGPDSGSAPHRFYVTMRIGQLLDAWPELPEVIAEHLADPGAGRVETMRGVTFSGIAIPPSHGPPASLRVWSVRQPDGSLATLLSHSGVDDGIRHVGPRPPAPAPIDPEDEPHSIGGNFQDDLIAART